MNYSLNDYFPFFPTNLGPFSEIKYLGSNNLVTVLEVNQSYIFRFANDFKAVDNLRFQKCLLLRFTNYFDHVKIPKPVFFKSYSNFPFGLLIFEKIIGKPLLPIILQQTNQDSFARQIAQFLHQFHSVKAEFLTDCLVHSFYPTPEVFKSIKITCNTYLEKILTFKQLSIIDDIWNELLQTFEHFDHPQTIVHGDFWHENILFDSKNNLLSGIVDFENVCIGDPIIDFVSLRYYGESFLNLIATYYNQVNEKYQVQINSKTFVLYSYFREIFGLYQNLVANTVDIESTEKIIATIEAFNQILK